MKLRISISIIVTAVLSVILMMAAGTTSLAAEKEIGEDVTYSIGDAIVVPGGQETWLIWDDASDIPNEIAPGAYTIGTPRYEADDGQFLLDLNDPENDDYLALGSEMSLTGDETVTGIKCSGGEGTEADPYRFVLILRQSGDTDEPVPYLAWDEEQKELVEKTGGDACTGYTLLKSDPTDETVEIGRKDMESWYVVDGEVSLAAGLCTNGEVHLILKDSARLTLGSVVSIYGNSLTIYAQSTGANAGILEANNDASTMFYGLTMNSRSTEERSSARGVDTAQ